MVVCKLLHLRYRCAVFLYRETTSHSLKTIISINVVLINDPTQGKPNMGAGMSSYTTTYS